MDASLGSSLTRIRSTGSDAVVSDQKRVVAIKYFLDRPDMDIDKASVLLFKRPPMICRASDVAAFLERQGLIKRQGEGAFLAEVYLDRFKAFMSVEMCDKSGVEFDLSTSSTADPATLAVRLSGDPSAPGAALATIKQCNMSPAGLYGISAILGLQAMLLSHQLMPSQRVWTPYMQTWSCYAFFLGGLLSFIIGLLEVFRNNIFGATAFLGFGAIWLARGLEFILQTYSPKRTKGAANVEGPQGATAIKIELSGYDSYEIQQESEQNWGLAIREVYVVAFIAVLVVQSFRINKATTVFCVLYLIKAMFDVFEDLSTTCKWFSMVLSWILSGVAFLLFAAELTNEVYGKEVFNLQPWRQNQRTQAFAAAGNNGAMGISSSAANKYYRTSRAFNRRLQKRATRANTWEEHPT